MSAERKGDWIQTYSGRQFWPIDPRPEEVFIEDIAAHLSKLCRYNGACHWLYTVAQHSIYVSYQVPPIYAMEGLLHDASEAYCNDLTRPVKKHLYEYRIIENRIQAAIAEKFFLDNRQMAHYQVKRADDSVLLAEKRHLMKQPPKEWEEVGVEEAPIRIRWWPTWYAQWRFLRRYREILLARR